MCVYFLFPTLYLSFSSSTVLFIPPSPWFLKTYPPTYLLTYLEDLDKSCIGEWLHHIKCHGSFIHTMFGLAVFHTQRYRGVDLFCSHEEGKRRGGGKGWRGREMVCICSNKRHRKPGQTDRQTIIQSDRQTDRQTNYIHHQGGDKIKQKKKKRQLTK